ncbi:MAG TPA: polysaccharide biosynthesis/export family protein [Candidatus Angelobacter sp.]|jgi:polysaccharide biosynthesis/export protein|nr:polysaccharide biosynthesis/export family protein [Candidatus Angelobacter sp.]
MKQQLLRTSAWAGLMLALMCVVVNAVTPGAEQDPQTGQTSSTKQIPVSLKIAPGDLLHITVFDVPEMTQEVRVGANGKAQLALIGDVALAGMTGQEAAETIARELRNKKLLISPQVNVLVKEFASQGVSVSGEVQHPGVYQILGSRTLLDLISMAGGLTNFADTRITVQRRGAAEEKVTVKLKTDDPETSLANNVQVYPGDLILVPRAGIVYVLGDVNRPGGFVMQDSGKITLLQALAQAGGASKSASLSKAVLMRKNAEGYATTKLHVGKIEKGEDPDLELHANDILFVPNNRLKNAISGTQSVITSIGSASIYAIVH